MTLRAFNNCNFAPLQFAKNFEKKFARHPVGWARLDVFQCRGI
jgi:hypothetical protein